MAAANWNGLGVFLLWWVYMDGKLKFWTSNSFGGVTRGRFSAYMIALPSPTIHPGKLFAAYKSANIPKGTSNQNPARFVAGTKTSS